MTEPATTVVIGLGNPLMGDDGVGLAALAALREADDLGPGVELVDGGTWGMNLLPVIEGAAHVIFLDAIRYGTTPGTVVVLSREELPRGLAHKLSPHQIDLREVLALGELRGTLPARMVAIGIEPAAVEMTTELSTVVADAMPELLERVRRYLAIPAREDAVPCTS